jgi:hypothetical protein
LNLAEQAKGKGHRFTGYYSPERSGLYDVFAESSGEDGGFYRLYVDDQLIFDNWTINTALMNSISLQFEDVDLKQWRANPGQFEVLVGSSSENIRLRGRLTFADPGTATAGPLPKEVLK